MDLSVGIKYVRRAMLRLMIARKKNADIEYSTELERDHK